MLSPSPCPRTVAPPRTQHPHRRAHQRRPCTAALTTAAPAVPVLPTPLPAALLAPAPPSASIAARQRRHPPRRPIKPRIPSLHCGGPRAQLARIAPYASPSPPRMRAISPLPGSIFASCMLFGVKMARSSPHVSISGCNRAVLDTWRGNLAVKGGFSRRGARDHAWRKELASAARPLRGSGLQFGRMGFAPYRPYLACLTHECAPAILVALTAITPCRRLAIAAPPARCPRLTRTPFRPPIPLLRPVRLTPRRRRALAIPPATRYRVLPHCLGPAGLRSPPIPLPRAPPTPASPPAPHPLRPATRHTSPCRAGPAAVPVIPAKWCGDTIAHTRKLRF